MNINQKKTFIINILYYGIIIAAFFVAFKFLLPILTPFILAFAMAWVVQKPCRAMHNRFGLSKKLSGMIILILIYVSLGSILVLASLGLVSYIADFINNLPSFIENDVKPFLDQMNIAISGAFANMPAEIRSGIETIANSLYSSLTGLISDISKAAINYVTDLVTVVPSFFISLILFIISSFFFVVDYDKVTSFAQSKMNERMRSFMDDIYSFMKDKVVVIIKSYAAIMCITFFELAIGFFIIRLDGFIWIALSIAIFDILPVFGTGGIMIPWIVFTLFNGDVTFGVELAVIYVIVTIIRNIIEPKIVGGNLGLHPVLTLASMLVGAQFFGVIGLFGLPLFISFVLYLNKKGKRLINF